MSNVRFIMASKRLVMRVFRTHLPTTTRQSSTWSKTSNIINEKSVDWQKNKFVPISVFVGTCARDFSAKPSVDMKKTADLTGKWSALEYDEESWVRIMDALGAPDPRAAGKFYINAAQQEIIDKGDTIVVKYPDPTAKLGHRKLDLPVGQEWVGRSPMGYKMKMFVTRQDGSLNFETASWGGKVRHRVGYDLQGNKLVFSMTEPGSGITAKMVLIRKSGADSEDGNSG